MSKGLYLIAGANGSGKSTIQTHQPTTIHPWEPET